MKCAKNRCRIEAVSFSILAAVATFCGCDGPAPPANNPQAAATPPATAAETPDVAPSDAEAQVFAEAFVKSVGAGDAAAINAAIDTVAICQRDGRI